MDDADPSAVQQDKADSLDWIAPGQHGSPAQAAARIGAICARVPDLFGAMLAVVGTHQAVTNDILAMAVKQFRPDVEELSRADLAALLASVRNGGRSGFDAVMRARKKGERRAAALPWVQN